MKTGQDLNDAISEHQHLVKVLRSTSHDDDRREAKKQAAELKTLRSKKVRDGLPAKPAPEAYPGVELGDSLYIHHPKRGPIAVKVHAQGRHGITATDSEGHWHRAKWQHVLGAKQRLSQRLTLVDQGEDGAITEDESGQRRYVAIDPEAREDQPLRKSQPTAAQMEAGNYRKDHQRFQGLDISIENPKGSVRAGTDPGGKPWRIVMRHAYGYIRGTCGVDKDHVDCYLGPNPDASHAYVVHQRQAGHWSRYDEDKVMLGFDSAADAKAAYLAQYDDPRFFGDLTAMPMADFKRKALATRKRPRMIKGLVLFFKTHIPGYTKQDGTFVAPHEDKRMPAKEQQDKKSNPSHLPPNPERVTWCNFPDAIIHAPESTVKKHPDYIAAKAGNIAAAKALIQSVLSKEAIDKIRAFISTRQLKIAPQILGVFALESAGINRIPAVMADILSEKLNLPIASDIVQINQVSHTGASGWRRLAFPALFDGIVTEKQHYLIADDFIGQGGTLANLRGYIESKGGHVLLTTALTGKPYSAKLTVSLETLSALRKKHGDLEPWWRETFGYDFACLTESEARYLERAEDADTIRNRLAEARA